MSYNFTHLTTCDGQSEGVVGRPGLERDGEPSSGLERFQHVAHHVDLRLLVPLRLAPPDRVVEQVEPTVGRKLAVQSHRLARIDQQYLSSGQHLRHRPACNISTLRTKKVKCALLLLECRRGAHLPS